MDRKNKNDYKFKNVNFMAKKEIGDQEITKQYLSGTNLDETLAVNDKNKSNFNINNSRVNNTISISNTNNDQVLFICRILDHIKNIFYSCINPNLEEEEQVLRDFPNLIGGKSEKKAKVFKIKLEEEPKEDNPDCTTIIFKYPDGERRIKRRFLKNNNIQNLYDYVNSLGKEIYTQKEKNTFSLFRPFPPNKFDNMKNTLEKEGLFPLAVIQIREE